MSIQYHQKSSLLFVGGWRSRIHASISHKSIKFFTDYDFESVFDVSVISSGYIIQQCWWKNVYKSAYFSDYGTIFGFTSKPGKLQHHYIIQKINQISMKIGSSFIVTHVNDVNPQNFQQKTKKESSKEFLLAETSFCCRLFSFNLDFIVKCWTFLNDWKEKEKLNEYNVFRKSDDRKFLVSCFFVIFFLVGGNFFWFLENKH